MSRRYPGKAGAPYTGSACHVTPLPGKGAATRTGGCSAGTKTGDLGGLVYTATGEGRRAMSRRYPGRVPRPTREVVAPAQKPATSAVLGLRTSWLRPGRVGVPCHAATYEISLGQKGLSLLSVCPQVRAQCVLFR